ncbi:hypothetical protein [Streptomyces sp. NPDC002962]
MAVTIELTHRPETIVEDPDGVVLVADIEELTAGTLPGCGEDNPYN